MQAGRDVAIWLGLLPGVEVDPPVDLLHRIVQSRGAWVPADLAPSVDLVPALRASPELHRDGERLSGVPGRPKSPADGASATGLLASGGTPHFDTPIGPGGGCRTGVRVAACHTSEGSPRGTPALRLGCRPSASLRVATRTLRTGPGGARGRSARWHAARRPRRRRLYSDGVTARRPGSRTMVASELASGDDGAASRPWPARTSPTRRRAPLGVVTLHQSWPGSPWIRRLPSRRPAARRTRSGDPAGWSG